MNNAIAFFTCLALLVSSCIVAIVSYYVPGYISRAWKLRQTDYSKLSGVPAPTSVVDFKLEEARPRPYRPFRWQYHQNMSLKKMEPDWWIELESTYPERIKQRKELNRMHGKLVLDALPGSEAACTEMMEMVIQFLCTRYPNQFQYDPRSGMFHNHILDLCMDTRTVNALEFLLDHVPEDFLVTQEDEQTGLYLLTAGIACSAVGWNISTKIGKPLHEIHSPVPDYKEKMQFSMDRFFSKLPCDRPIQRGSWSLEIGQPLYAQSDHPHFAGRDTQRPDVRVEDIHLRVDWQTLRRLPKSHAIVFNYKALFTPVTDLRREPFIPKLLAKILRDGKPRYLQYKSTHHIKHRVLPALDMWAKEQEEKHWVPKDWKERTLDEDPFYPGWERQVQGY